MGLLILVIFAIGNILLGMAIYLNNPRSWTNKLFSLLIFTLTLYLAVNSQLSAVTGVEMKLFLSRVIIAVGALINLFVFLFLHTFPKEKITLNRTILLVLVALTAGLFTAGFTPLIFADVNVENNIVEPVPGILMPVFLLHTLGLIVSGLVAIALRYRRSFGLERTRIRYVFLSFAVLFTLIIVLNFIVTVFLKFGGFVPFLPLYILIFNLMVAYAIRKHRLMDIRVLVGRAVVYALLVLFVASIYAASIYFLGQLFLTIQLDVLEISVLITLSVIIALTFHPLQRLLEKNTDKLLFRNRYDTSELLSRLSKIMASTFRLQDLTHSILQDLKGELKVTKIAFILLEGDTIVDVKSEGFTTPPTLDEDEVKRLVTTRETIIFDELEEGELKESLRKLGLSVVVHLRTEGTQVGLLVLGGKESGDIYSDQDLDLLEILAPEAAVAIQNAKSTEEIRRFNITLQEEVENATSDLRSANEKLQELDKLKDEFVSLASHELRTPMTAIKGSISTILEGYAGEISNESREFLTSAYNENDRLIRLVNNLLNISRIEAGRFIFNVQKVNIDGAISEVVKNLQMAAKEKSFFLKYERLTDLPPVIADEDKVKEVLINLIGNAIKFTHEGGITIRAKREGEFVITSIADTGHGISKEDQEILFQKFSRVQKEYSKQAGGTGLGLYICKQIVEGHKGKIWLESEVGKGSTFYFSLPASQEDAL